MFISRLVPSVVIDYMLHMLMTVRCRVMGRHLLVSNCILSDLIVCSANVCDDSEVGRGGVRGRVREIHVSR